MIQNKMCWICEEAFLPNETIIMGTFTDTQIKLPVHAKCLFSQDEKEETAEEREVINRIMEELDEELEQLKKVEIK